MQLVEGGRSTRPPTPDGLPTTLWPEQGRNRFSASLRHQSSRRDPSYFSCQKAGFAQTICPVMKSQFVILSAVVLATSLVRAEDASALKDEKDKVSYAI